MTDCKLDDPILSDNRNYVYQLNSSFKRTGHDRIADMIKSGSRVIDLGCGDGGLLQYLEQEKACDCYGVEFAESGVRSCVQKGLNACQARIDQVMQIKDQSYDYAICSVTLQMVMYPEVLLSEMKRIARYQILTFPNFAYWKNRIDLLVFGRMPKTMLFGYEWYNTGHIHQLSYLDFVQLINSIGGLTIEHLEPLSDGLIKIMAMWHPNLFSKLILVCLKAT